jgi:predicted nucleic acid-binding protein
LTQYLDTSLLVAALTNEANSSRVQMWFSQQVEGDLVISDWVEAEFSAALSIKLRTGQLTAEHRSHALAGFSTLRSNNLTVLPVPAARFHDAARFADRYELGLRAGDALHLAICAGHRATLCTLDRRLASAGPALGVGTTLV